MLPDFLGRGETADGSREARLPDGLDSTGRGETADVCEPPGIDSGGSLSLAEERLDSNAKRTFDSDA